MFSDPLKNLKAIPLHENNIVADLGAGTGYYSVAAGKLVPHGKVYAVEIVKDFLHTIKNKAKEAHLNNVEIIWGDIEKVGGTKIGSNIVDVVLASNVLFQVDDKQSFIKEIHRILKKGGKVMLVDWTMDSPVMGGKGVVPKSKAQKMFEENGFTVDRDIDAGAHHYGMILIKS